MQAATLVMEHDVRTATLVTELTRLLEEPSAGPLASNTPLKSYANWDSLTKVSLVGFIADTYGVTVDGTALDNVETVDDIAKLIAEPAAAAVS